jgi:GT2 family glycosyltransferase
MLLPVLYVTEENTREAIVLLEHSAKLGRLAHLLIAHTGSCADGVTKAAKKAASKLSHLPIPDAPHKAPWPGKMNHGWQYVARHFENESYQNHRAWLWWETDAVPLRAGWLPDLAADYRRNKRQFMGAILQTPQKHMHRVGVWPMKCVEPLADCAALYTRTVPFDLAAAPGVLRDAAPSDLIAAHPTLYHKTGVGLTGHAGRADLERITKKNPKAVLYHGISLLLEGGSVAVNGSAHTATVAPLYTISVLCLNNSDLTRQCVESIIEHSDNYELFITNNGSTDDTAEYLEDVKRRLGGRVTIITNAQNKGFQEPNEDVLKQARGRYFVLFNNDMVACEGWLEGLREPFDSNPKMALTGLAGVCCRINEQLFGVPGDDNAPEYIEGGCLMGPVALLRKHGLFSDYLRFIYWEDTDLGLRMREIGYEIATVRLPITHHHRTATTRNLDLKEVRQHNHEQMWKRWAFYVKRRTFERRIVVKRRGARGDVLLATPALAAIHRKWPKAIISVETAHPEMLVGLPRVRTDSPFTAKDADHVYDLDFSYERKPGTPIVQVFAEVCGVTLDSERPVMVATESDKAWAMTVARGLKVALIHPGPTTWPGKNWPVERFHEIVKFLRALGFYTISVGAANSPVVGCDDSVAGVATVSQLYALCCQARLLVGLDSMPQHVASAANLPSVVLFGATEPKDIMRKEPFLIPVQASREAAECAGAHGRRTTGVTEMPCSGECMKALTPSMVMEAISKI